MQSVRARASAPRNRASKFDSDRAPSSHVVAALRGKPSRYSLSRVAAAVGAVVACRGPSSPRTAGAATTTRRADLHPHPPNPDDLRHWPRVTYVNDVTSAITQAKGAAARRMCWSTAPEPRHHTWDEASRPASIQGLLRKMNPIYPLMPSRETKGGNVGPMTRRYDHEIALDRVGVSGRARVLDTRRASPPPRPRGPAAGAHSGRG